MLARKPLNPAGRSVTMPREIQMTRFASAAFTVLALASSLHAGELAVVSVSPALNASNVSVNAAIHVDFNMPLDRSTVNRNTFWAFARWSGVVAGQINLANDDHTISLEPDRPFSHGEQVTVFLSHDILSDDGSPLRAAGYSWQFVTRVRPTPMTFSTIASLSTRTSPGVGVRSYGGIASDLNHDGWLDLTMVNEDSADLRVFVHTGNPLSPYSTFLPPFPVGPRASPSEPSDFNRDGHTDITVVNINSDNVSILLGNGNGGYLPQQLVSVGDMPRGNAVLDADGDGDVDIVNTNSLQNLNAGNLSLLLNNGHGVFGAATFFEGGGTREWPLAAADMTNDGILDLVVGANIANVTNNIVNRANGDGTFTPLTPAVSGSGAWMLVCGDLNNDGNIDVANANSGSNNGARLLGNGAGGLGPAQTVAADTMPIGSDIGDLDGDGDLDWVISSFNGDWWSYTNNGGGTFAFHQKFNAPQTASCALFFDCDNDGDLDLGLIDETADLVILMRNSGIANAGDATGNGTVDVDDLIAVILAWGPCATYAPCPADVSPWPNGDDEVDVDDLIAVILNWE
jgi:hypothetical protein